MNDSDVPDGLPYKKRDVQVESVCLDRRVQHALYEEPALDNFTTNRHKPSVPYLVLPGARAYDVIPRSKQGSLPNDQSKADTQYPG